MIAEWEAVKRLLESHGLNGRVKDSAIDGGGEVVRGEYVVLYGAGPDGLDDDRYGSIPRADSDSEYVFPVRAVSGDPEGVRLLAERLQQVVGTKPVIPGRRADPVTVEFEQAKVDNSVSPPLYFQDVWVRFGSRRA